MTKQLFEIGDDFEAAARRAVADEAGELARMEAAAPRRVEAAGEAPRRVEAAGEAPRPEVDAPDVADQWALVREHVEAIERLHPELAARVAMIHRQADPVGGLERELEARLALIHEQAEAIEGLHRELAARLDVIRRIYEHVEAIEGLHRELAVRLELIEWQARALGEFRTVLVLLRASRVYRVMLTLGRWGWLDRRIRRALRA